MTHVDPALLAAAPPHPGLWSRACTGERLALEQLISRFSDPAYAWIRACGIEPADAARYCRGFLAQLATATTPTVEDPIAFRFREHFLFRLKASLVQGWPAWDGPALIGFEPLEAEKRFAREPSKTEDEVYARRWSLRILELSLQSLQEEHTRAGQAAHFAALKPFLGFHPPKEGYSEVAPTLGMSASAFHFQVFEFRERYRAVLRGIVRDTTLHAEDVDSELTVLLLGAS